MLSNGPYLAAMLRHGVLCLAAALIAGLGGCAAPAPSGLKAPLPAGQIRSDGAVVYATACAACHDGGLLQAPRREALAALPAERIEAALTLGVMRAQAAGLSANDRAAVAKFLSHVEAGHDESRGLCPTGAPASMSPVQVAGWGMGLRNARAVDAAATAINQDNVAGLKLDWVFAFPNGTRARVQPTLAGDTLFTADQTGAIYALDAATGCIRWQVQTEQEIRSSLVIGADASGAATRLYFGDIAGAVHAFDIASKRIIWTTRPDAHPQATITGTLQLFEGRVYVPISSLEVIAAIDAKYACCTFRGAVAALDADTGEIIWKTYTIDDAPSERGVNREGALQFGPSGAPVWSSPTIDVARRRIYVGTGENYSRPASSKSDSILALDLATGRILWTHQALAEDVWNAACPQSANCPLNTGPDYDFGAPPILVDLSAGKSVLLAGQKSGFVYALDPDREGALIWKAKPGRGGIMGGVHWGMTTDGAILYAPISDLSVYPKDAHLPAQSGMHALEAATGKSVWSHVLPDTCGATTWRCSPGISAAATLAPGLILGGSLDGMLRAFSTTDGAILWSFDTNRSFEAVNGEPAHGGGIDSSGPVVAGSRVYATSGYDKFGQKAGNLLLAFSIDQQAPTSAR
jgi:polyvinyl alcohol dehydrogenase (cytochrome)